MKYVLIFALVVVIAKIDTVMKLFDKASVAVDRQKTRISNSSNPSNISSETEVVGIPEDPTLKIKPHTKIISLMESYKLSPEPEIRVKIMEDIKVVPKLLMPARDPELESAVNGWRDLLLNNHEDTMIFLISLENLLQGENQIMIRKFFSLLMDQNLESFLKNYMKTRDVNCKAASYFGDPIPEEEKINEYRERDEALEVFLKKENLDPALKNFATLCQLVVRASMIPTVTPSVPAVTPATPEDAVPAISPEPMPAVQSPPAPATTTP